MSFKLLHFDQTEEHFLNQFHTHAVLHDDYQHVPVQIQKNAAIHFCSSIRTVYHYGMHILEREPAESDWRIHGGHFHQHDCVQVCEQTQLFDNIVKTVLGSFLFLHTDVHQTT